MNNKSPVSRTFCLLVAFLLIQSSALAQRGGGGGSSPPDPGQLSASGISGTEVSLAWNSGGGSTAGFIVAYQTNGFPKKKCLSGTQIDVGNVTSVVVNDLDPDTLYYFRVCAYDSSGRRSNGVTATASTLNVPPLVDLHVETDYSNYNTVDEHYAMAIQSDGKIVAAGLRNEDTISIGDQDWFFVRYNVDGSLDTTFGTNGETKVDVLGGYDVLRSVEVDATTGKILASGRCHIPGPGGGRKHFGVVQLNSDGSLDTSFDGDGVVAYQVTGWTEYSWAMRLSSGKIIVTGYARETADSDDDVYLARLNADGSLDTSFGANGFVVHDVSVDSDDLVQEAELQADGKIVVVGSVNGVAAVMRFNTDGSFDSSFGSSGVNVVDLASGFDSSYWDVALDAFGNLFVVGESFLTASGDDSEMVVTMFDSTGTIDIQFGDGGTTRINPTSVGDLANQIMLDGFDLVVAGRSASDATLSRLDIGGEIDFSFANGMYFFASNPTGGQDSFNDVAVDANGKYVTVGHSAAAGAHRNSLLMRFNR